MVCEAAKRNTTFVGHVELQVRAWQQLAVLVAGVLVDPVAEEAADVGIRRAGNRLVGIDLLVDIDVANADVAAPGLAAEVRLHVGGEIRLAHLPLTTVVVAAGRAVVVREPGGVGEHGLAHRTGREVPEAAREVRRRCRSAKSPGYGTVRAVLQVGPDVAGARAFGRLGFTLVVGVARAEVERTSARRRRGPG